MSKVFAIMINTFKEAVRNRILYVLLFFAVLVLVGSWVASTLSIANQEKVMRDLGVAGINIIGLLMAVFVGIGLVYNELDKKTIYTIISKPIARWQFILGKYLGLLLTIYLNVFLMTWFFCAVLHFRMFLGEETMMKALMTTLPDGSVQGPGAFGLLFYYIKAAIISLGKGTLNVASLGYYSQAITQGLVMQTIMICMELGIITAFAVLYSSFSTPTLSAFLTVLTFIIGRLNSDLYLFAQTIIQRVGESGALTFGQKLGYWILMTTSHLAPNLEAFNLRAAISNNQPLSVDPWTWVYGIGYSAAMILIAAMVFNRRNFK